jgi:hypothetical protein
MATRLIQTALGPRMAAMEEKADRLLAARYTGGAKAPPTPTSVTDEDVEWAEESLAHPDAASRLCKGAQIAVGTTPDGPRAISVLLYPLQAMSVREALERGLVDWRGRLNRLAYERAIEALKDRADDLRSVVLP